jgi:hypothetical protein
MKEGGAQAPPAQSAIPETTKTITSEATTGSEQTKSNRDNGAAGAEVAEKNKSENSASGTDDNSGLDDKYWPVNTGNFLKFPRRQEIMRDYFMGGLERYEAMLSFLKSLHALNGIDKPIVQFRVLTRGYASSTNTFLKDLGLKEKGTLIHSVWDTQGVGFDGNDKACNKPSPIYQIIFFSLFKYKYLCIYIYIYIYIYTYD